MRDFTKPKLPLLLVAAQAAALLLVAWSTWPLVHRWHGDVHLYFTYSLELFEGKLPYRDFRMEYPPLAVVPFALPRLAALGAPLNLDQYRWLFLALNTAFCTLIALAIARIAPRRADQRSAGPLARYGLLVALMAPLLPWRYDIFPALLTILALLAVLEGRPALAGVWTGLGVAAKLYPVVLLPIFGLYFLARGDLRSLARLAAGSVVATLVSVLPFLALDAAGLLAFLQYHQLRGIQIESLAGGAICLASVLGLTSVEIGYNYGALHLVSPMADALLPWHTPLFVLLYGLVAAVAYQGFRARRGQGQQHQAEWLVACVVVALLVFVVTNKVFSPQYLVWLLPFAPLLPLRPALAFAALCAATVLLFPFAYDALLALEPWSVLLLNGRNVLALALVPWLLAGRPRPVHAEASLPHQTVARP